VRLVPTNKVVDGMVLARDIISSRADGAPLLRRQTTLTSDLAARAAQIGIRAVWIHDDLGEGIIPAAEFPQDVLGVTFHAVTRGLDAAHGALVAKTALDHRVQGMLVEAAAELAEAVLEYPPDTCAVPDLGVVAMTPPWHAARVALLGTFIGRRVLAHRGWTDYQGNRRFDRFGERLTTLATGLLIHDIGVPPGPDGPMVAEANQPEEHVQAGADLFPAEAIPVAARVALRNHHERWDGSGYPDHKAGDAIPMNARIAAIADAYDALTCSDKLALDKAIPAISQGARGRFDPSIIEHFVRLVLPYPIGHMVSLDDGRDAVVVRVNSASRLRPTVRAVASDGTIEEFAADLAPGHATPVPQATPVAAAAAAAAS
jgi:hypothetical protein